MLNMSLLYRYRFHTILSKQFLSWSNATAAKYSVAPVSLSSFSTCQHQRQLSSHLSPLPVSNRYGDERAINMSCQPKLQYILGRCNPLSCHTVREWNSCQANGNEMMGCWSLYATTRRFYQRKKTIRIAPTKDINFDWGGDLSWEPFPVDEKLPRLEFDQAEEYESADDTIKRILSIEFGDGHERQKRKIYEILEKVKEHPLDVKSLEVKIAYQTVAIRNQMRHVLERRKDKRAKSRLVERLQSRRKGMKKLRALDLEKFTWLCDELQIEYIPVPLYNRKLSKRATQKREARLAAITLMKQKTNVLKAKFAAEKTLFEERLASELADIGKQIEELKLDEKASIVRLYRALEEGKLEVETTGKQEPPKSRRRQVLEKKFEIAAQRRKEMESAVQT